jgi:hypothetical protein
MDTDEHRWGGILWPVQLPHQSVADPTAAGTAFRPCLYLCSAVIAHVIYIKRRGGIWAGAFGLCHSDFFRISDFGLRILSCPSVVELNLSG